MRLAGSKLLVAALLVVIDIPLRSADLPDQNPDGSDEPAEAPEARQLEQEPAVRWGPLFTQSLIFLGIEHGFRYATEHGTRDPNKPFFKGYIDSLANLHGWADGDPFYVNYIGHPMQGAVSAFMWVQNDPRFSDVQFGRDRRYWKSRLRATAFSWAYSTQMEIGPLSEASIGNIQAELPQQGFVDQVITPAIGFGWVLAEDAIDHYMIRAIERRTNNRLYRALIRGGLNPTRSFANVLGGRPPWARLDEDFRLQDQPRNSVPRAPRPDLPAAVPPFELAMNTYVLAGPNHPCVGGGSTAAFRIHPKWQIVADVNGCKMTGQPTNLSGDSLTYLTGPRWTPLFLGRWQAFFQFLVGGNKLTEELFLPDKKAALVSLANATGAPPPSQSQYTVQFDSSNPAISAGGGLDFRINNALALRVLSVDYTGTWVHDIPGFVSPNGFQIKAGFILRMGTW